MRHSHLIHGILLLALLPVSATFAESAAELLEQGIYKEETAGDLDGAIAIYGRIVAESKASRALVAQAQFRLGMCQLKKGQKRKAAESFERVQSRFADQTEPAKAAAAQLRKLEPVAKGSQDSRQPLVLRTIPPTYANDVSASLTEIVVRFDRTMMDKSWSWTGGGETFPKTTGEPRYDRSRKICKLPVKLEPGKVYFIGVNSPSYHNFQTTRKVPAVRYAILFATAAADGKPTPLPENLRAEAKAINASYESGSLQDSRNLLDEETRANLEEFERGFAPWFRPETAYEAAGPDQRNAMVERWMKDARTDDFKKRTRAIAALGNVKSDQALDVLMEIADEPMSNNRPKWMAVRALGRIGDRAAIPTLIELVDHGNQNVRTYARFGLAQITGVYFKDNKAQWRKWWQQESKQVSAADRREAERTSQQAWKLWRQQKFTDAEAIFKKAVRKDPTNANAWNGLGWSQFNQGSPLTAKVAFQHCLEAEPKHAAALNGLGWIAKSQGKADEAITHWKAAVAAVPGATAALAGLCRTYMEQENFAEAVKYYELWVQAEPNNKDAKAGLAKAKAAIK